MAELAKDGEYAGNDAVVAFSRCYGVHVIIHQLNAPRWEVHAPSVADPPKTVHIAYLNGEHYCSVQPLAPATPAQPLPLPQLSWDYGKGEEMPHTSRVSSASGRIHISPLVIWKVVQSMNSIV